MANYGLITVLGTVFFCTVPPKFKVTNRKAIGQALCFPRAALLLVIVRGLIQTPTKWQIPQSLSRRPCPSCLVSRGRSPLNCLASAQSRAKAVQDLACGSERAKPRAGAVLALSRVGSGVFSSDLSFWCLASVPFYLARAVVLLPVWFGSFGACGGAYWLCGCCWLCAWACCAPCGVLLCLLVPWVSFTLESIITNQLFISVVLGNQVSR